MKNIKSFDKFINEAVIMPKDLPHVRFENYDQLKEYCEEHGIDLVNYEEFYNSLSEQDKTTAPPDERHVPFFALFHRERMKPMFVLKDPNVIRMIPPFSDIFFDIISHEMVHAGQQERRGELTFSLPDPKQVDKYFSDKDEVMAFAWTIASEMRKGFDTLEEALKALRKGHIGQSLARGDSPARRIWNDVSGLDEKLKNKYRKYIYAYLKKLYKTDEED